MVALTYGVARRTPAAVAQTGQAVKNFFERLMNALAASQMQRAQNSILRYQHLLPLDHPLRENIVPRTADELPFGSR